MPLIVELGFHNTRNATSLPSPRNCSVVLYCEVWPYRGGHDVAWRQALEDSGWGSYVPGDGAAKANVITWDPAVWELVDGGYVQTVKGIAGVTPSRSYVWARLRHTATGEVVRYIVTHLVSGARFRPRMWAKHRDMLDAFVTECDKAGESVVVAGDFNRSPAYVRLSPLRLVVSSVGAKHGPIDQIWANLPGDGRMGRYFGSDHPFMRASLAIGAPVPPKPQPKPAPEVIVDDRYELTTYDGKTVDRYTYEALKEAERRLGYALTLYQGSYHRGVAASAKTHWGGGVVDAAPWDWENKVRVLRAVGFAAWYRPKSSSWNPHIHAVLIGNTAAHPEAKAQVDQYRRGENGLANHAKDTFPRPNPIPTFRYPTPPPPSRIQTFRKSVEEALAVTVGEVDAKDRPAAARMLAEIQAALDKGPKA